MNPEISRRQFVGGSVATAVGLAASQSARAQGANERIRLGFIGTANRGGQLLDAFLEHDDAEVAAVCDVYQPAIESARKQVGNSVPAYSDFRQIIDDKDIDAVVIATPDHWHAIQTIDACNAGKDVYVEKPLCKTVREGRRMVEAARRNNRVVQVGTHRRSSPLYARLADIVQGGRIGHVSVARCYRLSNMYPDGIGKAAPSAPPEDLHWDMWLGPRPERPYQDTICPYKFRWWKLYSSQMGNWGVHYLDAIRWMTGDLAPRSVCAMGGVFAVDDDRTIPDTLEVTFQFDSGRIAVFGQYEANGARALQQGEIELRGTQGTAYASGPRFEIIPERGGQFQDSEPRMDPIEDKHPGSNRDLTALHARNFLDCIKSREKPHADIEIGHRSTTFCHLANMSLAVGERLEWDAEKEMVTNHEQANELLHYEYREPWKLG